MTIQDKIRWNCGGQQSGDLVRQSYGLRVTTELAFTLKQTPLSPWMIFANPIFMPETFESSERVETCHQFVSARKFVRSNKTDHEVA